MLPAAVRSGDLLLGRSSAAGQDAEGGSSSWLQQERVGSGPLEEDDNEWGWRDEGSQSTSVASQGSTALLLGSQHDPSAALQWFLWLRLGLGPHGTFGGWWQQVSSLLSSGRSNLLVLFLSRSLHTPGRRFW